MLAGHTQRLQDLVNMRAEWLAGAITQAARASRNEREFQTQATALLADFAEEARIEFESREEYSVANGRVDAVHSRLVIEYEAPNSMRASATHRRTAHAIQQVQQYMEGVSATDHHGIDRLLGVAFDGSFVVFVRHREGRWHVEPPLPWNVNTAGRLLRSVIAVASGRALNAENLVEDFQAGAAYSQLAIQALYHAIEGHDGDLPDALFRQWKVFFSVLISAGRTPAHGVKMVSGSPRRRRFLGREAVFQSGAGARPEGSRTVATSTPIRISVP